MYGLVVKKGSDTKFLLDENVAGIMVSLGFLAFHFALMLIEFVT